jgi:hypothetical protein
MKSNGDAMAAVDALWNIEGLVRASPLGDPGLLL